MSSFLIEADRSINYIKFYSHKLTLIYKQYYFLFELYGIN